MRENTTQRICAMTLLLGDTMSRRFDLVTFGTIMVWTSSNLPYPFYTVNTGTAVTILMPRCTVAANLPYHSQLLDPRIGCTTT